MIIGPRGGAVRTHFRLGAIWSFAGVVVCTLRLKFACNTEYKVTNRFVISLLSLKTTVFDIRSFHGLITNCRKVTIQLFEFSLEDPIDKAPQYRHLVGERVCRATMNKRLKISSQHQEQINAFDTSRLGTYPITEGVQH